MMIDFTQKQTDNIDVASADISETAQKKPLTPAERKRRSRANRGVEKQITVELTQSEFDTIQAAFDHCASVGSLAEFYKKSLRTGSKFVANTGAGRKLKSS